MHSLFDSRFWLTFEFLVRLCNLELHRIQVSLDLLEQISVLLNDSIYLIRFNFLVRRLVLVNLLISNLFHVGVILVTHDQHALRVLRVHQELVNQFSIFIFSLLCLRQSLTQINTDSIFGSHLFEFLNSIQHPSQLFNY